MVAIGFALLALVVVAAVAIPWLTIVDAEVLRDTELLTRAGEQILSVVLWALIGVAIGTAVHSQVAALVGTLVWIFLVENLLVGLLGLVDADGVAEYLPFHALDAADGTGADNLLSYGGGLAVTLGWILLLGAFGICAHPSPRHQLTRTLAMVAAPVAKDEELELTIDSLAYGGNGVARLNGFVVFVRRGLPGDTVRARVTKVKRNHAEALATEVLAPGPCASMLRVRTTRLAAAAASRTSPTRRSSRRSTTRSRDALRRLGGIADPPLEQIVPAA